MIALAFTATFVVLVLRAGLAGRRGHVPSDRVRVLTLLVALALAAGGIAGVVDLARDPVETWESAWGAYLLFGAMFLGGIVYATGTITWTGRLGFTLRLAGWLLVAGSLAVPSTLILLLPVLLVFVLTLTEVPSPAVSTPSRFRRRAAAAS